MRGISNAVLKYKRTQELNSGYRTGRNLRIEFQFIRGQCSGGLALIYSDIGLSTDSKWLAFSYCYGNTVFILLKFQQLAIVGVVDMDVSYEADNLGSTPILT